MKVKEFRPRARTLVIQLDAYEAALLSVAYQAASGHQDITVPNLVKGLIRWSLKDEYGEQAARLVDQRARELADQLGAMTTRIEQSSPRDPAK